MGSKGTSVQLKVFVDKRKNKVMIAEADEDFVEILFSFFTLPLGTIAKLSSKHTSSKDPKVGSLTTLYQSVVNLDSVHFSQEKYKDVLLNPINSSGSLCRRMKINLNTGANGSHDDAVLVKKKGSFVITDDLYIIPFSLDKTIQLLKTLGVEYIDLLDERTIYFGPAEFSNLLKLSLLTKTPLSNLVLVGSKLHLTSSGIKSCTSSNSVQHKMVKLVVQKSTNKVLCAQVENFFVELLFSFLTIPLGTVKRLTMDISSLVGINKVYHSIVSLGDANYFKSEGITTLLCPLVAANYHRMTDLLPIYDKRATPSSFLKEQATFIVTDDLEIAISSSISTISKFTFGIHVDDLEVLEVSIGEPEALLILNASLTSTSVLTDCLNAFRKNPKTKSLT